MNGLGDNDSPKSQMTLIKQEYKKGSITMSLQVKCLLITFLSGH